MTFKEKLGRFWNFLNKDSWSSLIVWIILIVVFIKLIFFPGLSLITGTKLPLVVVESCSMYHESVFDEWWNYNGGWYENNGISKEDFLNYEFTNGINKGDIMFVVGKKNYSIGDIIIFNGDVKYPIIHRVISTSPIETKGDHNPGQLDVERDINRNQILGKTLFKVPYIGWVKLIFFEPFKSKDQRGLCA